MLQTKLNQFHEASLYTLQGEEAGDGSKSNEDEMAVKVMQD